MKQPPSAAKIASRPRAGLPAREMAQVRAIVVLAKTRPNAGHKAALLSGRNAATAAEAVARTLRHNLYRIDLSAVVSKFIGETEKNLRRVFDATEASNAILILDEADALFGKRSDVKDAHDRFANAAIDFLLQRIAKHRRLVMLVSKPRLALPMTLARRFWIYRFPPIGRA